MDDNPKPVQTEKEGEKPCKVTAVSSIGTLTGLHCHLQKLQGIIERVKMLR